MDRQESLIAQLRIDRKNDAPKRRRWPWVGLLAVLVASPLLKLALLAALAVGVLALLFRLKT